MKEKIIQKYVDMLTKEDIVKFASFQNEILTNNEVDFLYNIIKKEWKTTLFLMTFFSSNVNYIEFYIVYLSAFANIVERIII